MEDKDTTKRWPEDYALRSDCSIRGSNLCWRFSGNGCDNCNFSGAKKERESQEACSRWEETLRLVPRDIDELIDSKTCWFCAGDEQEEADGYALLEMANPEPYFEKGIIFGYGKKVRSPVGSLLSIPIAVGKHCRHALRMLDIIQVGWLVGMFVLSILLLLIPQIATPMVNLFPLLPVGFVALMTGAGYYIGRNLSLAYAMRHSDKVRFDPAEIPIIRKMMARDWYFFQTNHGLPRMTFTKHLTRQPLFAPRCEEDGGELPGSQAAE